MRRSVSLADKATRDLEDARRWLHQPGSGPDAWQRFERLLYALEELRAGPCRWPRWDRRQTTRKLVSGGYAVIYRVRPDTGENRTSGNVTVLRVYGPFQNR